MRRVGSAPDDDRIGPLDEGDVRKLSWRLVLVLIGAALGTLLIINIAGRLRGFFTIIFLSLFLSFAIEPAVNWLADHGWRRGYATGLIFAIVLLGIVIMIALIVPAVVSGIRSMIDAFPGWLDRVQRFLARFGIDISPDRIDDALRTAGQDLASYAADLAGNILGIGASLLGFLFQWATIALFTFYMCAEGPQFRRAILRFLRPERQARVLFIWNTAIDKTGGYFYSRLLLAVINGTGMYIVLKVLGVPFAAPLAVFEGVVSEFIPTIGTYLAGIPPVVVALITRPAAAIGVVAYILIYQQVENYFLSPRLTAKTMQLHPAVAFGAALIGGSLGGVLMAFLALPAAAVIQAAISTYADRYEVVADELTTDDAPKPRKRKRKFRLPGADEKDAEDEPPTGPDVLVPEAGSTAPNDGPVGSAPGDGPAPEPEAGEGVSRSAPPNQP
jgi:predicted PurR-regulated permease PerM